MAGTDLAFRMCRYFKRAMFVLCRYPVFSPQYIRHHIDLPHTEPKELQDYKDNLVTIKKLRAMLLVSVYLSYTLKNIYVLYAWLDSFDYENYKYNLKPLGYDEQQLIEMNYSMGAATLQHISCLYTNCTRLGPILEEDMGANDTSPGSMALLRDVSRLPVLALCYPILEVVYYTPATKIGALGIYAFLVTMYTHLLLGSWTTIQQMLLPATNDLIMTITSPKVTHTMMRLRTCELLRDLAISLQNFRLFSIWNQTNDGIEPQLKLALTDQDQPVRKMKRADSNILMNMKLRYKWRPSYARQMRIVSAPPSDLDGNAGGSERERGQNDLFDDPTLRDIYFRGKSEQEIRRTIDNCMPVVCTLWWRPYLACILAGASVNLLLVCILVAFGVFTYVAGRVLIEEEAVREFGRQIERRNCFVWLDRVSSFAPDEAISMDELNFKWNVFSFFDAVTLNFIGGITGMMLFANYWVLITHISVWLAEMRMFIVASLLATRFQHERDRREAERDSIDRNDEEGREENLLSRYIGRYHFVSTQQFYNIPNLRDQFKESIRMVYMYVFKMIERRDKWTYNSSAYLTGRSEAQQVFDIHLLNSKHSDRNYADRFLAEILYPLPANIDHPEQSSQLFDRIDYDIETMEQIYVNFRLLVSYVRSLNSAMRVLITVTYLLNYGYILASIICRRKFNGLNQETLFMSVIAFMITNYLIFLSADFHANAKQVQPLLWSLIAQLTYSKKLRVQHLRSLWIKQTANLDSEGGLALIAYGVPITYVFIIQLVIWTATIFVLSLKPHGQEG